MSDTRTVTRSRENTRARLMDAALEVFAEVGLDAASVEAICERAGFTRGAFYSNFESKDELFLELASAVAAEKLAAVTERVREVGHGEGAPSTPSELVQRVVDVAVESRQSVLLMGELRIRAMRDRRVAEAYLAWIDGMTTQVEGIIGDIVRAFGLRLRMPGPECARLILALWETTASNAVIEGLDETATRALVSERTRALAGVVVEGFLERDADA